MTIAFQHWLSAREYRDWCARTRCAKREWTRKSWRLPRWPAGVIRSERRDGYLLEFGPQSFQRHSAVLNLCRELEIENQLVQAPARAPRYVLVMVQLREVPLSPPAFMKSSLFSLGTKLSVLKDVLGGPRLRKQKNP